MSAWRASGIGVGVGAKPQQFGVVEVHPGVFGQLQVRCQAGAGLPRVGRRRSTAAQDGVEEGEVDVQLDRAQGVEERGHGRDVGRAGSVGSRSSAR